MPGLLADRTWRTAGRPVLVVPVGSTEQHGPHLPLDTDTVIARAVAGALADRIRESGTDAVVTAPVAFGASGEHQAFPGTLSIGTDVLAAVLVELPLRTLKLDRSIVDGVDLDPRRATVMRGVVDVAHDLGLRVVAEGVEHPHQARLLRSLGCSQAQGFLYSHAVPASAVPRTLRPKGAGGAPARPPLVATPS